MKFFLRLALLGSLCLAPLAASADSLEDALKADTKDVIALLESHPDDLPVAELKSILDRRFSFYTISRRALGRGWNDFSEAQQEEFVSLFTDLLVRTYASRYNSEAAGDVEVTWQPVVDLGSKKREVSTTVRLKDQSAAVVYRLAELDGEWKIYDVLIEGVSLISNYREQFNSLLVRGGPEDVLTALRDKSTTLEPVNP